MTPESADHHYLKMLRLSQKNERQNYDIEIKIEDGSLRNVKVNALQMEAEDGGSRWHVALLDFTENKEAEDAFHAEKDKFAAELDIANKELIFQNDEKEKRAAELFIANKELSIAATVFESQEGMFVTDANNNILRVNHAFTKITGYSAVEVIGKTPHLLSSGKQDKAFYTAMWKSLNNTGEWAGEIWNRRKNGEVYPQHLVITAVKGTAGVVSNYVATLIDITISKAASEAIKTLAFYDPLTLLPNRRLLLDRLSQTMSANTRNKTYGALMFLDLDNFKPLNDTHGHVVGDMLLIEAAQRLTNCMRDMDTVARFGGDEFVVILAELDEDKTASTAHAAIVAEKIRAVLSDPYVFTLTHDVQPDTTIEHRCSVSIGVVMFIDHASSQDDIIKWADTAMYEAKDSGRNQIRFYGD